MDDSQVRSEIAYLDDFPETTSQRELVSPDYLAVIRAVIQLEMAKQAHWPDPDKVAFRLASLESRVEAMRHLMLISQRGYPKVQYISMPRPQEDPPSLGVQPLGAARREFPKSLVVFYSLGLVCSILFAVLLALSAVGINAIHPFLSLLGFVGGIGWLTTAWTDLLSLKAGNSWRAKKTSVNKSNQPPKAMTVGSL
jgi:hypothetical protein